MKAFHTRLAWAAVLLALLSLNFSAQAQALPPISLHPQNPHYFLFRGRPTVLVTSGEHYGAVMNPDFDYVRYLEALHADGLNLTRLFTGAYVEPQGAFQIQNNTMAPAPGRFLCPWARSSTPGYAGGGAKFDLAQWDEAYFRRLKDFVAQAGRRGVVVELDLFCPYYEDAQWQLSPLNPANNVNRTPDVARTEILTLKHPELVALEDRLVRKIAEELAGFDNLYYEICNEPYFGGVTLDWQAHIAETIRAAEPDIPRRHLIAQNIANGSAKVERPNPAVSLVSLLNFHYAHPPDAVAANFGLQRAIGCNESGFQGVHDQPYRTEGWDFLLAGGALYNNLDYSFTTVHPDGTAPVEDPTPGGGGPALRKSLATLKRFMESFDFIRMQPDTHSLQGGVPSGATVRVLSEAGKAYAAYVKGGDHANLTFTLPSGRYQATWVNPKTGAVEKQERFNHSGGNHEIVSPAYSEDIVLDLRGLGPVPTRADVPYGPHPHQLLDLHLPPGDGPFPVVLWFGGLWAPSKGVPDLRKFFAAGCGVVGVQMRVMGDAETDKVSPPVAVCMLDARRALQFVRLHAAEWKIDPQRIAVAGGSQGTLPALYLGCSGEHADPNSADPVERQSTLVTCVGAWRSQPSIDPKRMQEWVPGVKWGAPALGCSFEESQRKRDELLPWIREWSPDALLHRGAPPIYFENNWGLTQPEGVEEMDYLVHSPRWGLGFQKLTEAQGVPCYVKFPGHPTEKYADMWEFLLLELGAEPTK